MVGARMVRWIEESHLDLHEARVLLALSETGRPMTAAEIAELSGLDLDSAYQAVNLLHGRGLTDEDSRRHALTGRGRALMRSFAQTRLEGVRAYVGKLGRSERQLIEQALRQAVPPRD